MSGWSRCSTICRTRSSPSIALDDDARAKRLEQIKDHYEAREQALERKAFGAPPYNPVPPESLFLTESDWQEALAGRTEIVLDPFEHPGRRARARQSSRSAAGRVGHFAPERQTRRRQCVRCRRRACRATPRQTGKRVLIACWSKGAKERLATLLAEHGIGETLRVDSWQEVLAAPPSAATAFAVLPLETGFEAPGIAVIGEQDILGDRLVRRTRAKRGSDVLTEISEPHGRRSRRACRSRHRPLRRPHHHRGCRRAA